MKIANKNKEEIIKLIEKAKVELGSYTTIAKKCKVNTATITHNMLKLENWSSVSDEMWVKVGMALGYRFSGEWTTVPTTNLILMKQVFEMAQKYGEMKCISHPAGGGKSKACEFYRANDDQGAVFYIECEKWSHREFMIRLAGSLGIVTETKNLYSLADSIIVFFKNKMAVSQPLLIIDQADKLPNRSLAFLIQFYNKLKYECGCVLVGTQHLADKIKKGVRKNAESFDELDDRLGRNYVNLLGYTKQDVSLICQANGVNDQTVIEQIWEELQPEQVPYETKYIKVVKSGRRLETVIMNRRKRELSNQSVNSI